MSSDESRESLIGRARRLVEAGQVEQALKACQQRLAMDVFDIELWNYVGDLNKKLGRKPEALEAYRKAARLFLEEGEVEQSIAAHERLLSTYPQDVATELSLAAIYRKQGQHNRAALWYERAAQALAAEGQLHESLAVVQMLVDMSPDNVARRVRLANQYARANMTAHAMREFSAAETFLHKANRNEDAARVAERRRKLEANLGAAGKQPHHEAANSDGTSSLPRRDEPAVTASPSQRGSGPSSLKGAPIPRQEDTSALIAEAESFLRLGLLEKAAEHLSAALVRNPFLRGLREPLVKLYVAQGKYKQAVGELWELLSNCPDQGQEIRFLRYLLRLDSQDQAARKRLSSLTDALQVDEPDAKSEAATPLSVAAVDGELRSALGSHRPPTDSATTQNIDVSDSRRSPPPLSATAPSKGAVLPAANTERPESSGTDREAAPIDEPPPPSEATRPGLAQIEAIAEEIALSSVSFRAELSEIDRSVQSASYDDALRRLRVLAACYPHNQTVRAQLAEIEQARHERIAQTATPDPDQESRLPVSSEIAAAMRTLLVPESPPSQTTATAPLTEAQKPPLHTTLEVDLTDVMEEPNHRAQTRPTVTALPTGAQKQSAHTTLEVDLTDVLEEPDQRPQTRPMVSALPTRVQQKSISTTLEVDLTDVLEESSRRPAAVASPRHPPPPPPKSAKPLPERSSAAASVAFRNSVELRKRGQHTQAICELEKVLDDPAHGARAALLLGICFREQNRFLEAIASFMRGVNMPAAREADLSELFYELGQTHELARDPKEAVVFFQLSLGSSGGFRDAAARIQTLQQVLRRSR